MPPSDPVTSPARHRVPRFRMAAWGCVSATQPPGFATGTSVPRASHLRIAARRSRITTRAPRIGTPPPKTVTHPSRIAAHPSPSATQNPKIATRRLLSATQPSRFAALPPKSELRNRESTRCNSPSECPASIPQRCARPPRKPGNVPSCRGEERPRCASLLEPLRNRGEDRGKRGGSPRKPGRRHTSPGARAGTVFL